MNINRKITTLLLLIGLYPFITGFVLLSNKVRRLPVTPESPDLGFVWDGNSPSIEKKDEFMGGIYQDLEDDDFMQQLLISAFAIWNEVPGSYIELSIGEGDASLNELDQVFSIVVESNDNLTTAAFSSPHWDHESNSAIIDDCDISIADHATDAKSLAYTIAHEVGHCLGLGHPHTNYNAMMGYARDKRSLSLGADDVSGLMFLYPNPAYFSDGEVPLELVNCGTVGVHKNPNSLILLLLFLAPILCFGIYRKLFLKS